MRMWGGLELLLWEGLELLLLLEVIDSMTMKIDNEFGNDGKLKE